jgi:hypothetical protein
VREAERGHEAAPPCGNRRGTVAVLENSGDGFARLGGPIQRDRWGKWRGRAGERRGANAGMGAVLERARESRGKGTGRFQGEERRVAVWGRRK